MIGGHEIDSRQDDWEVKVSWRQDDWEAEVKECQKSSLTRLKNTGWKYSHIWEFKNSLYSFLLVLGKKVFEILYTTKVSITWKSSYKVTKGFIS